MYLIQTNLSNINLNLHYYFYFLLLKDKKLFLFSPVEPSATWMP